MANDQADQNTADSSGGGTTTQNPDDAQTGNGTRYSREDFRLNLDAPIFHRDERMPSGEVPLLREIEWEQAPHHPTAQTPEIDSLVARVLSESRELPVTPRRPVFGRTDSRAQPIIAPFNLERSTIPEPAPFVPTLAAAAPAAPPIEVAAPAAVAPVAEPEPVAAAIEVEPEPIVEPEPVIEPEPVAAVIEVEPEPVVEPTPVVEPEPVVAEGAVADAAPATSADAAIAAEVDADVNRLAMVPDREDTGTGSIPVVEFAQPELTPARSAPQLITPALPTLSNDAAFTARAPVPIKSAATVGLFDKPMSSPSKYKKKKRHLIRKTFSMLIVLAMIGGGVYALKRYVLDKKEWQKDVKPLAEEAQTFTGLKFKEPVAVQELGSIEYSTQMAGHVLGIDETNIAEIAGTWRATGVLQGDLDLEAIGRTAAIDAPAYYDPIDHTIYVMSDLDPELHDLALRRVLVDALTDQNGSWTKQLATADPSAALGLRASVDGPALVFASSQVAATERDAIAVSTFKLASRLGPTSSSPYAAHVIGRAGLVLQPLLEAGRLANPQLDLPLTGDQGSTVRTDASIFNYPANDEALAAAYTASTKQNAGAIFWYYALAGRIGDTAAWTAATTWLSDTTVSRVANGRTCVDATIVAADATGAPVLLQAFQQWAAAAPAESETVVASGAVPNSVSVSACDPGVAATTMTNTNPVAFGGSVGEYALMSETTGAAVVECTLQQARARNLPISAATDQAPITGTAFGWKPAWASSNEDLIPGCGGVLTPAVQAPATPAPTTTP